MTASELQVQGLWDLYKRELSLKEGLPQPVCLLTMPLCVYLLSLTKGIYSQGLREWIYESNQ